MLWQPYTGVNFWRGWGAQATTTFGLDQVQLLDESTRTEIFAGLTAKLDNSVSLYSQLGYQFVIDKTADNSRHDGVRGDLGFRVSW